MSMETTKDKRVKREIANSNERRRMQSINAGFQKLKRLLPVNDGEKLSKAAILQHAAEFIQQIEREKLIIHEQNTLLRNTLIGVKGGTAALDTIDLDALPIIPIHTRISMNTSSSNNANSNCSSTDNSNDDCSKDVHQHHQQQQQQHHQHLHQQHQLQQQQHNKSLNKNEVNKNGNKQEVNENGINDNNNFHKLAQPITSVAEIISDRVTSPNGMASTGVAKAAIALPLEVPYISEAAIRHHDLHPPPTKMLKTDPTNIDPQDPAPKGQNLDTICKAIMEIEGERVFTNENIKHEAI